MRAFSMPKIQKKEGVKDEMDISKEIKYYVKALIIGAFSLLCNCGGPLKSLLHKML